MSRSSVAYRLAIACGALPLWVGVAAFVTWLAIRQDWLMLAGIATLLAGSVLFVVGIVALGYYCLLGLALPATHRRRFWISAIACALLLFSNFPIAIGLAVAAVRIATRYEVIVTNDSQLAITDVRVVGGGCDIAFGTIKPGESLRWRFFILHDGQLELEATLGPTKSVQTLVPYVTHSLGGSTTVSINTDGVVVIH